MNKSVYKNLRVAFTIMGCEHCKVLKMFLDRFNINLPFNKRIRMVDCTKYHDLEIIDNSLIRLYKNHIKGTYPVIFIGYQKLEGATCEQEVKVFLNQYLSDDLILPLDDPYQFDKNNCRYEKDVFGRKKLVCE